MGTGKESKEMTVREERVEPAEQNAEVMGNSWGEILQAEAELN